MLTFDSSNYGVPQSVQVTGVQDTDLTDESLTITVSSAVAPAQTVAVTVSDDDSQSVVVSQTSLTVAEGGTGTFTARLAFDPRGPVAIAIASSDALAASASPATLNFTSANYAVPQTVTVTGAQDSDVANAFATLTLSSAVAPNRTVAITVNDDDVQAFQLSATALSVTEGSSGSFTVRLAFDPGASTTVNLSSSDTGAAVPSPSTLTFTSADYTVAQTVTVSGLSDDDVANESLTVTVASQVASDQTVAVTVTDDDTQAIVAAPTTLTVNEGSSTTLSVRLAFQPPSDVTITAASGATNVATVGPTTLTFTPTNYSQLQALTVAGVSDVNVVDDTTTITLSAAGLADVQVPTTVVDINQVAMQVTPSTLTLTEGGAAASFTVVLTQQPAAATTVTLASSDIGAATVSAGTLTFSTANWNVPQTVQVSPVDDADTAAEAVTITVASTGLTSRTVSVNVTDDDTQAIQVSSTMVSLNEGGTATFDVSLAADPITAVTVSVASSDAGAASVSQSTLTFSSANYATTQSITVFGVADADLANETVFLTLSTAVAGNVVVTANVTDDDTQAIQVSQSAVTLTEGASSTVNVNLAFIPASNVTVTITSTDAGAVTAAPATLVFTPSNYSTQQTITLTAVQDLDTAAESTFVSLTGGGAAEQRVTVTVTDDDAQALQLSASTLTVAEGATGMFTVRLAYQPQADAVVTLASSDAGAATPAPTSLTFTPANWDTPQSVTVSGVSDADVANEAATITVATSVASSETLSVTVTDDDVQALQLSQSALALTEGASGTFTVRMAFEPGSNTTVNLSTSDVGAAAVNPGTLTFTAANYATPQTITVMAVQDTDVTNEMATVAVATSVAADQTVTVTVTDDDTQAIVANPTTLVVNEGASGTLSVSLAYQPAGTVTVSAASGATTVATVSPASLTFDSANWNQAQTLTVAGVTDANVVTDNTTVTLTATGLADVLVPITVNDADQLNLQVSVSNLSLTEGGAAGPFTVVLTQQPASDVTVTLASSDVGAASVTPATMTFTPATWNVPQNASAAPVDDADTANEALTLTVSAPGVSDRTVSVSVTDDDAQALQVSESALTVTEGGAATFTVRLAFDPVTSVAVNISSSDTGAAGVSPAVLNFTSANYATPQTVTVTGVQDVDVSNESATISVASAVATTQLVTVSVTDDDTQALQLSASALTISESGTGTFTVRLAFDPGANTTVTIASSDPQAASVAPHHAVVHALELRDPADRHRQRRTRRRRRKRVADGHGVERRRPEPDRLGGGDRRRRPDTTAQHQQRLGGRGRHHHLHRGPGVRPGDERGGQPVVGRRGRGRRHPRHADLHFIQLPDPADGHGLRRARRRRSWRVDDDLGCNFSCNRSNRRGHRHR